jgi:cytochrome c-type biogenesis protein CcmH/NrfG
LIDLGNAWVAQTNYEEAVSSYRKALQIEPGNAELHYNLGVVFAAQNETTNASQEFQEALRLKPDFDDAKQQLVLLSLSGALKSRGPNN